MSLCSCKHQSLQSEDVRHADVDFKAVCEAAFGVTTYLMDLAPCVALQHQMVFSLSLSSSLHFVANTK